MTASGQTVQKRFRPVSLPGQDEIDVEHLTAYERDIDHVFSVIDLGVPVGPCPECHSDEDVGRSVRLGNEALRRDVEVALQVQFRDLSTRERLRSEGLREQITPADDPDSQSIVSRIQNIQDALRVQHQDPSVVRYRREAGDDPNKWVELAEEVNQQVAAYSQEILAAAADPPRPRSTPVTIGETVAMARQTSLPFGPSPAATIHDEAHPGSQSHRADQRARGEALPNLDAEAARRYDESREVSPLK